MGNEKVGRFGQRRNCFFVAKLLGEKRLVNIMVFAISMVWFGTVGMLCKKSVIDLNGGVWWSSVLGKESYRDGTGGI